MIEQLVRLPGALLLAHQTHLVMLGMLWEPLDSPHADFNACRARAQFNKATHYIRHHSKENVGQLGWISGLKAQERYFSGALLTLEQLGESWLAMFEISAQTYWVVAAHNGCIVPAADIVFATFEEARARYEMLENLFPWEKKYFESKKHSNKGLPFHHLAAQWNFSSSTPLISLYAHSQKNRRRLNQMGFFLSIIGLLWSTFEIAKGFYERKTLRLQQELVRIQRSEAEKNSWRQLPPADEFLEVAIKELSHYPLQQCGWRLNSGAFDGQMIRSSYQKTAAGTHQALIEASQSLPEKLEFPENFKDLATFKKNYHLVKKRDKEHLSPLQARRTELQTLLERGLISGKMDPIKESSGLKSFDFSFSSSINPKTIFFSIPLDGISFKLISFSINSSGKIIWNFSGKIYGT